MGRDPTNVRGLNGLGSTFWIEKSPSNDWAEHETCANPDSKYFCDDPHLSPKITLATGQLFVRPKHQGRPHITKRGQVSSAWELVISLPAFAQRQKLNRESSRGSIK